MLTRAWRLVGHLDTKHCGIIVGRFAKPIKLMPPLDM